jgi:hypothetical protein
LDGKSDERAVSFTFGGRPTHYESGRAEHSWFGNKIRLMSIKSGRWPKCGEKTTLTEIKDDEAFVDTLCMPKYELRLLTPERACNSIFEESR